MHGSSRTGLRIFGPAVVLGMLAAPALAQRGGKAKLPDGPGREQVTAICTSCHRARMITRSAGYTEAQWRALIGDMIDLRDHPDYATITAYLARNFPPTYNKRRSTLVPGTRTVSFRQWKTPTLGQRTRDPVEAPDGSVWWAGQFGNLIGRLDRSTGAMKEYALPPDSFPHSVTPDRAGNIWYTGNKNGTVGRLDPKTGRITVYRMPDPAAKDPHTLIFDRDGIAFFTLQHSNMVGRLNPATGDIRLVRMPTPRSRPYGIKPAADGGIWIACNGSNCLVRMDPETMAMKEFRLPGERTHVRRLDIAADGAIWYVNSGRGRLGRLDPDTGAVKEWASPSGPKSHPYAIAVLNGIVWYNESGVRPDPLVRFDPKTGTFQSWAIPSGAIKAGIIRHMRPTRDGKLLIHQSSTNRILEVTPDGEKMN